MRAPSARIIDITMAAVFPVASLLALSLSLLASSAFAAHARVPRSPVQSPQKSNQPVLSRYDAERDVEVGTFYFKKGKYDAAISRYLSAIHHDPHWAEPHRLLGEAYDKKNDPKRAIAEYRIFLKITPYAKQAKKVERRVEELSAELKKQERGR